MPARASLPGVGGDCGRFTSWSVDSVIAGREHQGLPLRPGCCPPGTFGAGCALIGGVNKFPPLGSMLFSVGAVDGLVGGAVVVVDVDVDVDGAGLEVLSHPAINALIAIRPTQAPHATGRLATNVLFTLYGLSSCGSGVQPSLGGERAFVSSCDDEPRVARWERPARLRAV